MSDFLLFQLYGALASWGEIAVGEQRPTTRHPSKSAVFGLIAAALGIRRDEDEKQQQLADSYGFAVRIDSTQDVMLRDYHTTQKADKTKSLKHLCTRKDELGDSDNLQTILSSRDYRCDGFYSVCLWLKTPTPAYAFATIQHSLRHPRFVLYLGRKSCPLALPIQGQIVSAPSLAAAFTAFDVIQAEKNDFFTTLGLSDRTGREIYWEEINNAGLQALHTVPRNDHPLSRRRRQFSKRDEHYGQGG